MMNVKYLLPFGGFFAPVIGARLVWFIGGLKWAPEEEGLAMLFTLGALVSIALADTK